MAYPLHRACMKDAGAELVDALVCAGAQLESRAVWRGTGWRTQRWEGTPLFKAACVARYDSVQELVWQGASLKAPSNCMMEGGQIFCVRRYLGHHLMMLSWQLCCTRPHTGKCVSLPLLLQCTVCPASCSFITCPHVTSAGCCKTLTVMRQRRKSMGFDACMALSPGI